MQQRQAFDGGLKIARIAPEIKVRHRAEGRQERSCVFDGFDGKEAPDNERRHDRQQGHKGGKDAANAPPVEIKKVEPTRRRIGHDVAADQIAGNDEEDIDPDISAAKVGLGDMKDHHRKNGDRSQTVDIAAIRSHLFQT